MHDTERPSLTGLIDTAIHDEIERAHRRKPRVRRAARRARRVRSEIRRTLRRNEGYQLAYLSGAISVADGMDRLHGLHQRPELPAHVRALVDNPVVTVGARERGGRL